MRVLLIEQKKYKTMNLRDHRQETKRKENKTHPVGLGINMGYLSTQTRWPVGLEHQHSWKNITHNDDRRDKAPPQLHPPDRS
jgi:hypothetical protein